MIHQMNHQTFQFTIHLYDLFWFCHSAVKDTPAPCTHQAKKTTLQKPQLLSSSVLIKWLGRADGFPPLCMLAQGSW